MKEELTDREKSVLRYIVQQFILTASPVGSRNVTKKYNIGYSPATVRNIMSDLEESGFINHPHTSAGRVPTDKGYRFYVDSLMEVEDLNNQQKEAIHNQLESYSNQHDELLNIVSRILSTITNQLACVLYPRLDSGTLEKIQIVELSASRFLVVISIRAGLVKTITLELKEEVKRSQVGQVESLLNERLAGLSLAEIRSSFRERLKDVLLDEQPILTLFFDSIDKIFGDSKQSDKVIISGTSNLLKQPEFENPEKFQSIIELIENKNIIVHVFDRTTENTGIGPNITIGSENALSQLDEYSLVTKEYSIGDIKGTLGVIGPKRMEYAKVVAIINYISTMLTDILKKP